MNRIALRPFRFTPPAHRLLLVTDTQAILRHNTPLLRLAQGRPVSSVAEVSFWKSLIPKPFRGRSAKAKVGPNGKKEWNPATFFIFIFLFIGSMSIQMIALRKDFSTFTRQADVRIGLLREVVEKLQRGEDVDVERVLGTGDPEKEQLWEQVLREIEREEPVHKPRKKKQQQQQQQKQQQQQQQTEHTPASTSDSAIPSTSETEQAKLQSTLASKGFY